MINEPVEIIRTVLLVALFAILIYILYRRMLKTLGKEDKKADYAHLESLRYDVEIQSFISAWSIEHDEEVTIVLIQPDGSKRDIFSGVIPAGTSDVNHEVGSLSPGKYEFKATTSNQVISRMVKV